MHVRTPLHGRRLSFLLAKRRRCEWRRVRIHLSGRPPWARRRAEVQRDCVIYGMGRARACRPGCGRAWGVACIVFWVVLVFLFLGFLGFRGFSNTPIRTLLTPHYPTEPKHTSHKELPSPGLFTYVLYTFVGIMFAQHAKTHPQETLKHIVYAL